MHITSFHICSRHFIEMTRLQMCPSELCGFSNTLTPLLVTERIGCARVEHDDQGCREFLCWVPHLPSFVMALYAPPWKVALESSLMAP